MTVGRPLLLIVCVAALLPRAGSSAQIFEGDLPTPALQTDPSVRSTAMAGATAAVFWGMDPNHWANPSLLGYAEGIRYEDSVEKSTIPVSLIGGDEFIEIGQTARRWTIGYGGVGLALAGRPFDGSGGTRWHFAEFGEEVSSWSAGVSLAKVSETIAALHGRPVTGWTRHLDLAFGYSHKTLEDEIFNGHGVLWDWGVLARAGTDLTIHGMPVEISGAYGYSELNRVDNPAFSADRLNRHGIGLHIAAARLPEGFGGLPKWLRSGFEPLLSIGGGFDIHLPRGTFEDDFETWGGELGLAKVLFLRLGKNRASSTRGFGIGLPIGSFGGMRYDEAVIVDDPLDRDYRAWSVWIDPLAIARAGR